MFTLLSITKSQQRVAPFVRIRFQEWNTEYWIASKLFLVLPRLAQAGYLLSNMKSNVQNVFNYLSPGNDIEYTRSDMEERKLWILTIFVELNLNVSFGGDKIKQISNINVRSWQFCLESFGFALMDTEYGKCKFYNSQYIVFSVYLASVYLQKKR